jgi:hypothetical protein
MYHKISGLTAGGWRIDATMGWNEETRHPPLRMWCPSQTASCLSIHIMTWLREKPEQEKIQSTIAFFFPSASPFHRGSHDTLMRMWTDGVDCRRSRRCCLTILQNAIFQTPDHQHEDLSHLYNRDYIDHDKCCSPYYEGCLPHRRW